MPTTRPRFALWTYDQHLFEAVKLAARREGRQPSAVVEDALRHYLAQTRAAQPKPKPAPPPSHIGPSVNLAAAVKVCPICDQQFLSATQRQIYCSAGNRRCMKYAQRYGVEHGRRMYAAKHPPRT